MKTVWVWLILIVACVLALTPATSEATLQGKLGQLLGIEKPVEVRGLTAAPEVESMTSITAWLLGTSDLDSQDNEFVGRIGVQLEDVEICFESNWQGVHGDRQSYGVAALMHLLGEPGILGEPYVGYHATIIDAEDGGAYGPILGTKYPLGPNLDTAVEGWYRDFTGNFKQTAEQNDVWKLFAGIRWRF